MRHLAFLLAATLFVAPAFGQTPQQPQTPKQSGTINPKTLELFQSMKRPSVLIYIREHSAGPDLVEISMLQEDYPAETLREQCLKIGTETGSEVRGLEVLDYTIPATKPQKFLRASFATDNIIDRPSGRINLNPVVRAFAGVASPHTIESLTITLWGEVPSEKTLRTYSDQSVNLAANQLENPAGIEYRVEIKDQNPGKINIPIDPAEAEKNNRLAKPAMRQFVPEWVLWTVLLIVGAGIALLVYFAALRRSR